MNVVVTIEYRFDRTPDGRIWTRVAFSYDFWRRYLTVFEQVRVLARVRDVPAAADGWLRACGEGVSFAALPYYVGPRQYLARAHRLRRTVRQETVPDSAVILRVPSAIASNMILHLRRTSHPFGVEVVGDPHDVLAPKAVNHPLRPFFRWWYTRHLRRQCAGACAAAYVTESVLQRRYPPGAGAFSTHFSSIELADQAFVSASRHYDPSDSTFTLLTIGSLEQPYKAVDIQLEAVRACLQGELDVHLIVIGDGKYRSIHETHAAALGITSRVRFLGQIPPGDAVRAWLDRADLFLLPSRTEGLPRAMIEAMARGLPCIGSNVGGIPELLPPEDLVPSGDADALTRKIMDVLKNPTRMAAMSARNLTKAHAYDKETLDARRRQFYEELRDRTIAWQQRREFVSAAQKPDRRNLHIDDLLE